MRFHQFQVLEYLGIPRNFDIEDLDWDLYLTAVACMSAKAHENEIRANKLKPKKKPK